MEGLVEEGRREEKKQKSAWNRLVSCVCCGERNRSCRIYWILISTTLVGAGLVLVLLNCNASEKCNLSLVWSLIFVVAFVVAGGSVCMFSCCPDGCKRGICCAALCDTSGGTVNLSNSPFRIAASSMGGTPLVNQSGGTSGEMEATPPVPTPPEQKKFVLE